MAPAAVRALCFLGAAAAQQVGTMVKEETPVVSLARCSRGGGCRLESGGVTLDANWRWLHAAGDSGNCYTAGVWDPMLCSDPETCATQCAMEGVDKKGYRNTYGVSEIQGGVELQFVKQGADGGRNVGSRLYMLDSTDNYKMFHLLNREFAVDVDISTLPCGLNGAVYFVEMKSDGGKSSSNKAGAKYGTGYCDAQCPRDVKFMGGQANILDWNTTSAEGRYGHCCAEMDILEGNSMSQAYTPHPCAVDGQYQCEGTDCGNTLKGDRYRGVCDKDGCDFNSFRMGKHDFYGPGGIVDSSRPLTIVTQFFTDDGTDSGDLSEIRRIYLQDGKVIHNTQVATKGVKGSAITEDFCKAQKDAFDDPNDFAAKGGLKQIGEALRRGVVLVLSLWDDEATRMLWLDSASPEDESEQLPGVRRGPCPRDSGRPGELRADYPKAAARYTNFKYGDISSTFSTHSAAPEAAVAATSPSWGFASDAGTTTLPPFDCEAGYSNWKSGWTELKKAWCCSHEGRGCDVAFDCDAGYDDWDLGWSQGKKAWCCQHMGRGCDSSGLTLSSQSTVPDAGAGTNAGTVATTEQNSKSFCCLAARDQNDVCGTCWSGGRSAVGSTCGGSITQCHACGATAKWCEDGKDEPPEPSEIAVDVSKESSDSPSDEEDFCCLASADHNNFCGMCWSGGRAKAGTHCGGSKERCQSCGGKATWCPKGGAGMPVTKPSVEPAVAVQTPSAPSSPSSPSDFCCLAAADTGDFCGTCWPGAKAQVGSRCGGSKDRCHACGGRSTWCTAAATAGATAGAASTHDSHELVLDLKRMEVPSGLGDGSKLSITLAGHTRAVPVEVVDIAEGKASYKVSKAKNEGGPHH